MTLIKHSTRTIRKPCERCGRSEGLYWAHDTDRAGDKYCNEHDTSGAFVLIEMLSDGVTPVRHSCSKSKVDPFTIDGEVEVKKVEKSSPFEIGAVQTEKAITAATDAANPVQAALATLASAFGPQINPDEIRKLVKAEISNVVFPTRTVFERANGERKEIDGKQHAKLGDVVSCLLVEEHVMMVGPAGTGKSTIAEQAAEMLGLASFSISLSPQTPASQLLGYMQATGDYVPSLFRRAYEDGGVFHFDEMDNAHPSVLAVINSALANGHMAFPDRMVKRHPDFRAVASANTYGRGANRSYVGRQAIDAATLDRFTVQTIEVDESLETDLCHSVGLESDQVERVLKFVRKLRKKAEDESMPIVISPRASLGMCRLLAGGMSWEAAVQGRVRRGLGDTDWKKINS